MLNTQRVPVCMWPSKYRPKSKIVYGSLNYLSDKHEEALCRQCHLPGRSLHKRKIPPNICFWTDDMHCPRTLRSRRCLLVYKVGYVCELSTLPPCSYEHGFSLTHQQEIVKKLKHFFASFFSRASWAIHWLTDDIYVGTNSGAVLVFSLIAKNLLSWYR